MTKIIRILTLGLALSAGFGPAQAQSFNCATNTAPDEKAICRDCGLGQLDVKLATMYEFLTRTSGMGARGALQDEQRDWLAQRARCGADASCLRKAYDARIGQLQKLLDDFYSRGPY